MKRLLLCFLLLFAFYFDCKAVIGIGYSYKNVIFWRFWEIKDGVQVPEILVYNTGDAAVAFTMRKVFVADMKIDSSRRKWYEDESARYASDTIVKTAMIPPRQFGVFVIGRETIKGGYDGAFINGRSAGIAGHKMQEITTLPGDKTLYKYYSYEGLYATPFFCLIAKNQLFTKRGETENLMLYFDFLNKDRWSFFEGINDIEVDIPEGVDQASVELEQKSYTVNMNNPKTRFSVNMRKEHAYNMNVACKIAKDSGYPAFDFGAFFKESLKKFN